MLGYVKRKVVLKSFVTVLKQFTQYKLFKIIFLYNKIQETRYTTICNSQFCM